jgi:hypothetical protein
MTKTLPWTGRFALFLFLPAGILPFFYSSDQYSRVARALPNDPQAPIARPGAPLGAAELRSPRISDWSTRHVVYTQFGTSRALEAASRDPRANMHWREMELGETARRLNRFQSRSYLQFGLRNPIRRFPLRTTPGGMQRDWNINLGTTGTANSMYPAKYTFNQNATPSCTADFVVFPISANGSTTQANIVGLTKLYSGSNAANGSNGFCNRTATGNDDGNEATVMWSYNVHAIAAGGAVPTSPAISLDGTKVAFVESATGNPAHFHVLAWRAGDTSSANLQTTTSPKAITTFSSGAPVATATTGVASDLALGSTTSTDTLSSPYIDYANDLAYVGNDIGVLYRIKNVFCTLPACTGVVGGLAPSIDSTWGTGGAVSVCTGKLTGPVLDFYNLNIYVGCSDGKLYSITQAGVVTSIAVGDGIALKPFGGIVDPPIVDGTNGFVYAVSGSAGGGNHGVLVQAKADFSSSVAVPIGNGNQCNIHAPALSNSYFTNTTPAGAQIYIGGVTGTVGTCTAAGATGGVAVLYSATLGTGGLLPSGAPANSLASGNPVGSEYAPIGEFFNSVSGEDGLFVDLLRNSNSGFNNIYSFNITSGFTNTIQNSTIEGQGSSGMVFDNAANTTTFPQASSLYFNSFNQNATCTNPQNGTNTNGCAIKLTQAGLE